MSNTSENIQAGDISGMGAVSLPTDGKVGSGDVPAGRKKKKKKKKLLSFEEYLNEAYQKDGHRYNTEEVGETSGTDRGGIEMDNAFVGKDGILGVNNVFISWSEIKRLQKKYRG
jgi:hypothetical protein